MRHEYSLRCSDRKGTRAKWIPYGSDIDYDTDSLDGGLKQGYPRYGNRSPGRKCRP